SGMPWGAAMRTLPAGGSTLRCTCLMVLRVISACSSPRSSTWRIRSVLRLREDDGEQAVHFPYVLQHVEHRLLDHLLFGYHAAPPIGALGLDGGVQQHRNVQGLVGVGPGRIRLLCRASGQMVPQVVVQ